MPGSMKAIRQRIKSVEGTRQLTAAMQLVAASKLRRAGESARNSRPYFAALRDAAAVLGAGGTPGGYAARGRVRSCCYVVMAGDRGLAGGYNANLLRRYRADRAANPAGEIWVLPVGRRAAEALRRRGEALLTEDFAAAGSLTPADCDRAARLLCDGYRAGRFDEVRVVYTAFTSLLTQTPALLTALPLPAPPARRGTVLYEPDAETVRAALVPAYLGGVLYGALAESAAAEQAARRAAMDAATRNAAEMIDTLTLTYNRARQSAVTQELSEIAH